MNSNLPSAEIPSKLFHTFSIIAHSLRARLASLQRSFLTAILPPSLGLLRSYVSPTKIQAPASGILGGRNHRSLTPVIYVPSHCMVSAFVAVSFMGLKPPYHITVYILPHLYNFSCVPGGVSFGTPSTISAYFSGRNWSL
ncbi:unnamed protein product [Rhizoctonia solani]|uniref:Uncharacterized protein n=1 Tax=Rhizoctonia solani TaxID=456999 RepID=A0A8H3GRS7_9AGAM|nr:unnamed protein product [Rhizoctonia solani]